MNSKSLNTLSFLLALLSIIYEFSLAQIISLFHGNTFTIYCISIGLYTFCLGFGALYFDLALSKKNSLKTLLKTEILLSLVALLSPFLILSASTPVMRLFSSSIMYFLVFLPVAACGFLSGIELPSIINSIFNKKENILFWDYLGMFIGSIFFGAVALEWLGAISLIWAVASINCLAAFGLHFVSKKQISVKLYIIYITSFLLNILALLNEQKIFNYFGRVYGF